MTNRQLATLTPATLAAVIAGMSQHLAEKFDSEDTSAQEWDAMHAEMLAVYGVLNTIVGEYTEYMLMEAGANPEMVYMPVTA